MVTSSPADPDPDGSRLRGWNAYAGRELRGVYCVLPQHREPGAPTFADAARSGAHLDHPPKHLVISGLLLACVRLTFKRSNEAAAAVAKVAGSTPTH